MPSSAPTPTPATTMRWPLPSRRPSRSSINRATACSREPARSPASFAMPVLHLEDVAAEPFKGGASYQTLVGDAQGSTPIRVGIQTSPPGYKTPLHSHPYLETITVLEGEGEAWLQGSD